MVSPRQRGHLNETFSLALNSPGIASDFTDLEADVAVCEQGSLHLDDGRLLVPTNQLDRCSAGTLLGHILSNCYLGRVEDFGQSVEGTGWNSFETKFSVT